MGVAANRSSELSGEVVFAKRVGLSLTAPGNRRHCVLFDHYSMMGLAIGVERVAVLVKIPCGLIVAVLGRDGGLNGIIRATLVMVLRWIMSLVFVSGLCAHEFGSKI